MAEAETASRSVDDRIEEFLACSTFAVVGASNDPRKYGARAFACYRQNGLQVYAVNPNRATVQGEPSYPSLGELPEPVEAISIVTQPDVTERSIEDAISAGVRHVWMQPGAESAAAIARAESSGLSVIHGGPCILVVLGYRE